MGISRKKNDHTFLSGGSYWPEVNASELHFGQSFQGYPTWPYLECGEQHLFYRKLAPSSIFYLPHSLLVAGGRKILAWTSLYLLRLWGQDSRRQQGRKMIFCKMVFCRYCKIDFFATLDFINSCMGQKSTSRALDLSKACQVSINSTKGIECILLRSLIDNCFICHLINTWRRKSNWTQN